MMKSVMFTLSTQWILYGFVQNKWKSVVVSRFYVLLAEIVKFNVTICRDLFGVACFALFWKEVIPN